MVAWCVALRAHFGPPPVWESVIERARFENHVGQSLSIAFVLGTTARRPRIGPAQVPREGSAKPLPNRCGLCRQFAPLCTAACSSTGRANPTPGPTDRAGRPRFLRRPRWSVLGPERSSSAAKDVASVRVKVGLGSQTATCSSVEKGSQRLAKGPSALQQRSRYPRPTWPKPWHLRAVRYSASVRAHLPRRHLHPGRPAALGHRPCGLGQAHAQDANTAFRGLGDVRPRRDRRPRDRLRLFRHRDCRVADR